MSQGSNSNAPFPWLLKLAALIGALVITFNHGRVFYDRSAPVLQQIIAQSDLWMWDGLIGDLWYFAAWPCFFIIAYSAGYALIQLIVTWLHGRVS
jgi:hypothetical protein